MVSCYGSQLLDYESYRESWRIYAEARKGIKIKEIKV
jgi:hypothetical protein